MINIIQISRQDNYKTRLIWFLYKYITKSNKYITSFKWLIYITVNFGLTEGDHSPEPGGGEEWVLIKRNLPSNATTDFYHSDSFLTKKCEVLVRL